jgi:type III secretory pathway component EscS
MTKRKKDFAATILGLITSLVMALTLIDFNTIDFSNPNDIIKLLVVLLPAIGGKVSTIKGGD